VGVRRAAERIAERGQQPDDNATGPAVPERGEQGRSQEQRTGIALDDRSDRNPDGNQ
jgi:hypothetical protein